MACRKLEMSSLHDMMSLVMTCVQKWLHVCQHVANMSHHEGLRDLMGSLFGDPATHGIVDVQICDTPLPNLYASRQEPKYACII